ncbi:MAG: hypothetical protein KAS32_18440 [Candidatus Peribacteraceae bacterium]|nr:hypothetical protein [Candidatus Peribacteraceae bacterium]
MGELVIESIVSEYKLKDLGSKNMAKLKKEIDKSVKSIVKMEKAGKKANSVLGRMGKGFKGIRGGFKTAGKVTGKVAGAMGGGFGGIPLIGGMLAAAVASIKSVQGQFTSGLALKKELMGLADDVQASFGKKSKIALKAFDKAFSTRTQQQQLLSELGTGGVTKDQIKPKDMKLLETFAKSQGKDLNNVFDGVIKSGRGLNDMQKLQGQQYMQLIKSQNPFEVKQGYELFINLLKQSNEELETFAKQNKVVNSGIQSLTTTVKTTEEQMQQFYVSGGRIKDSFKTYRSAVASDKIVKNMTGNIASGSASVIKTSSDAIQGMMKGTGSYVKDTIKGWFGGKKSKPGKKKPARAGGGHVQADTAYQINEKNVETFIPSTQGRVIAHNKNAGGNTTISMRPVFNIQGGDSREIMTQVEAYMDRMARSLSYHTGGNVPS